ncbi:hypothetical protein [Halocola ammonii]
MEKVRNEIVQIVGEKSALKQDVFDITKAYFAEFKEVLAELIQELQVKFESDPRLEFYVKDKGDFEAEVKIAGDILYFNMHTNIFKFDGSHHLWRSSYLRENELRGFVGTITVYNFLADSIKYQRSQDLGYLIARIFINMDNHFFVQGKGKMSFLHKDFFESILDKDHIKRIVDEVVQFTLEFDLFTPPCRNIQQISVGQIQERSQQLTVATGKRLGFKFEFEEENE